LGSNDIEEHYRKALQVAQEIEALANTEVDWYFERLAPLAPRYQQIDRGDLRGRGWATTDVLGPEADVTQDLIWLSNLAVRPELVSLRWFANHCKFNLTTLSHEAAQGFPVRTVNHVGSLKEIWEDLRVFELTELRIFWIGNAYVVKNLCELKIREVPGG